MIGQLEKESNLTLANIVCIYICVCATNSLIECLHANSTTYTDQFLDSLFEPLAHLLINKYHTVALHPLFQFI